MTDRSDLDYIRKFGDKCHAETTRKGELQACDKPAVAVAIDEDEHWYPVCAYHTRSRILVPLADLLKAVGVVNAKWGIWGGKSRPERRQIR